jgi:hypothetical protein
VLGPQRRQWPSPRIIIILLLSRMRYCLIPSFLRNCDRWFFMSWLILIRCVVYCISIPVIHLFRHHFFLVFKVRFLEWLQLFFQVQRGALRLLSEIHMINRDGVVYLNCLSPVNSWHSWLWRQGEWLVYPAIVIGFWAEVTSGSELKFWIRLPFPRDFGLFFHFPWFNVRSCIFEDLSFFVTYITK